MRTARHQVSCEFKHSGRLLPSHGREGIEKLVEAVASSEILEEDANGNSRAHEDGCSGKNLGIAVDDG
jgi:hypothetical protein